MTAIAPAKQINGFLNRPLRPKAVFPHSPYLMICFPRKSQFLTRRSSAPKPPNLFCGGYITLLDLRKAPPSPDQLISADSGLPSLDVATATSPSAKPLPTRADLAWERAILRKSSLGKTVFARDNSLWEWTILRNWCQADLLRKRGICA